MKCGGEFTEKIGRRQTVGSNSISSGAATKNSALKALPTLNVGETRVDDNVAPP